MTYSIEEEADKIELLIHPGEGDAFRDYVSESAYRGFSGRWHLSVDGIVGAAEDAGCTKAEAIAYLKRTGRAETEPEVENAR